MGNWITALSVEPSAPPLVFVTWQKPVVTQFCDITDADAYSSLSMLAGLSPYMLSIFAKNFHCLKSAPIWPLWSFMFCYTPYNFCRFPQRWVELAGSDASLFCDIASNKKTPVCAFFVGVCVCVRLHSNSLHCLDYNNIQIKFRNTLLIPGGNMLYHIYLFMFSK